MYIIAPKQEIIKVLYTKKKGIIAFGR